jgi:hypothetical protein
MRHITDAVAGGLYIFTSQDRQRASRRTRKPGNDSQERRLSSPVLSQQCVEAACGKGCAEVVKRGKASKDLAYAFEDDCRFRMGIVGGMDRGFSQASVGFLTHRGLSRLCRGRRPILIRGGSVLRGALGLNLLRMKDAIGSVGTLDQRLRIVLERIRRGFGAAICDLQLQPLLVNLKIRARALAMDAAGNYLSGNPQPLGMSLGTHALQLFDGDVIALAVLNPGEREIGKSRHNDGYGDAKTKISAGGGHGSSVFRALCRVKQKANTKATKATSKVTENGRDEVAHPPKLIYCS